MTTAPTLEKDGIMTFNFDGRFHPVNVSSIAKDLPDYFVADTRSHREQLWVHESTFRSLFVSAWKEALPYNLKGWNLTNTILE